MKSTDAMPVFAPHWLMPQHVSWFHRRHVTVIQVQVGAADACAGDFDDRIVRIFDRRVGNGVDTNVALAVLEECSHRVS